MPSRRQPLKASRKAACSSALSPGSGFDLDVSNRTALIVVASSMHCSSEASPTRLRTKARMRCPLSICLTAKYFAVAQRATHSENSSKESTVWSELEAAWPTEG